VKGPSRSSRGFFCVQAGIWCLPRSDRTLVTV
jgi:hypothetical protein